MNPFNQNYTSNSQQDFTKYFKSEHTKEYWNLKQEIVNYCKMTEIYKTK